MMNILNVVWREGFILVFILKENMWMALQHLCECCRTSLFYMIPFINMISIIGSIARLLYYQCTCKVDPDASYEGHLQRYHIWHLMMFIHSIFALSLSIPLFIYMDYFNSIYFIWFFSSKICSNCYKQWFLNIKNIIIYFNEIN